MTTSPLLFVGHWAEMLRGVDPLLGPQLLEILRGMGHGDELAIVDANFPATSNAQRLVRMDGIGAPTVLRAVLSVLPLDDFIETPVVRMEVVGSPNEVPEVCSEFEHIVTEADARFTPGTIERFEFYDRARRAFAIVQTGEQRLYGCILLTKGVIRPIAH